LVPAGGTVAFVQLWISRFQSLESPLPLSFSFSSVYFWHRWHTVLFPPVLRLSFLCSWVPPLLLFSLFLPLSRFTRFRRSHSSLVYIPGMGLVVFCVILFFPVLLRGLFCVSLGCLVCKVNMQWPFYPAPAACRIQLFPQSSIWTVCVFVFHGVRRSVVQPLWYFPCQVGFFSVPSFHLPLSTRDRFLTSALVCRPLDAPFFQAPFSLCLTPVLPRFFLHFPKGLISRVFLKIPCLHFILFLSLDSFSNPSRPFNLSPHLTHFRGKCFSSSQQSRCSPLSLELPLNFCPPYLGVVPLNLLYTSLLNEGCLPAPFYQ